MKYELLLVTWLLWYGDRSRESLLFVKRLLMVPAMKLWLVFIFNRHVIPSAYWCLVVRWEVSSRDPIVVIAA